MELVLGVLAVALGVIAVVIVLARTRPRRAGTPEPNAQVAAVQEGMNASVALLQQAIVELRTASQQSIAELRGDVQRSLGATEQQVLTQTGATQRTLGDIARQLGSLEQQSARVGDLAKDIGSLQDLLRAPKARGGFGELLMERLLEDNLPAGAFALQHGYRSGLRVDAVVRFADRLVPIDAKFPIESYRALADAPDEETRVQRRRAFVQQVKRHIDAVARYVSPDDGTIDFAFMYIPAEAVFYQVIIRDEEGAGLWDYCGQRHVIPTSPNTLLGYLRVVSLGLRGLAMQERTRELQEGIRRAALEIGRFREQHEQLGRHLVNAANKHTESLRALDRATDAIAELTRAPIVAPEQGTLPLPRTPDELLGDALGDAAGGERGSRA